MGAIEGWAHEKISFHQHETESENISWYCNVLASVSTNPKP